MTTYEKLLEFVKINSGSRKYQGKYSFDKCEPLLKEILKSVYASNPELMKRYFLKDSQKVLEQDIKISGVIKKFLTKFHVSNSSWFLDKSPKNSKIQTNNPDFLAENGMTKNYGKVSSIK
ncbi:hypothetical protein [Treponema sp.]|uniref:hypothetical protein n=1 Tax=Treponema sp. TaxID=166 RepID=UPI002A7ED725|nr:hypothetical protein [Treponema sp.]MDY4132853.1 hypothetical protein [Treponema sp.]